MKKSNFGFWALLVLSILFVVVCCGCAMQERETQLIGGEVFTIALPLWLVSRKMQEVEQEKKKLKTQVEAYRRELWKDL